MKILLLTATAILMTPPLSARTIEQACNKSQRQAANRTTCSCIQKIADVKLTRGDQNLVVTFFDNPHLAQETRQSDNPSKERFWLRYKEFGVVAADHCSAS